MKPSKNGVKPAHPSNNSIEPTGAYVETPVYKSIEISQHFLSFLKLNSHIRRMEYMKCSVVTIMVFGLSLAAFGQRSPVSAGFNLGGANYLGEIGGKYDPRASVIDADIITTSPAAGVFLRYAINDKIRVSGEVNYVHIRQADKNAESPSRQARNLNFRNRMFEFGFRSDFSVFSLTDRRGMRNFTKPGRLSFDIFVFTGIYGVLHNPQAQVTYDPFNEWEDRWYDLRPLRTEGQVEEYATVIASIPLGFGMEVSMGNGWTLGLEASWRSTFTDYLDDISGMYANPDDLTPLAEAISSQSNDAVIAAIDDSDSGDVQNHRYSEGGTYRGNPRSNDSYGTIQLRLRS